MKIKEGDRAHWTANLRLNHFTFILMSIGIARHGNGNYLIKYDTRNSALIKELFSLDK